MDSRVADPFRPLGLDAVGPGAAEVLESSRRADGSAPLGDGMLRALDAGRALVWTVRADDGDPEAKVVGLAVAAPQGERYTIELAVHPEQRGRGLGRALISAVLGPDGTGAAAARQVGAEGPPWFWSHGDSPAARRLAEEFGLRRGRELLQMRVDVPADGFPSPDLPEGVVVRPFRPGRDEPEWLRVNNAAFSWHPEQGGQELAEFEREAAAPDFDPEGFFLAVPSENPARVLGFHQTKIHPGQPPLGEVYVLGIDPAVQARGLGRALTLTGLRYLAGRGLKTVELYVEGDNHAALRLYRSLGFRVHATDVSYTPEDGHREQ